MHARLHIACSGSSKVARIQQRGMAVGQPEWAAKRHGCGFFRTKQIHATTSTAKIIGMSATEGVTAVRGPRYQTVLLAYEYSREAAIARTLPTDSMTIRRTLFWLIIPHRIPVNR